MDKGKNLAIGTSEELKKLIKKNEIINIDVYELTEKQEKELLALPHICDMTYSENRLKISYSGGSHNLIRLLDYLKSSNISFGRVYTEVPTLNDVFLEITGKELRDK